MTRTTAVNFSGALQFPMADAGTDIFVKEDVQTLAKAVDQHDHTSGKGLVLPPGAIPTGSITSAMIADGTIVAGDLADGAVTSAKILDGTIATGDIADGAVTSAKLATTVNSTIAAAQTNLLTNGGFEIWQRGAGPFVGGFTADRWSIQGSGAPAGLSVTRIGSTVGSQGYSAQAAYTHSAGMNMYLENRREGTLEIRGKTVTFAVTVKSTVAGTVKLRISDGVGGPSESAYNVGTGEERLSITRAISTTATQLNTYVLMDVASCTVELNDAMLVMGSVAADYAPLHPADDLARCLRYYQFWGASVAATLFALGQAVSATASGAILPFKSMMGVSPTLTHSGAANFQMSNAAGSGLVLTALSAYVTTFDRAHLSPTVASGLVAGNATMLQAANGNAVIYIEGNP